MQLDEEVRRGSFRLSLHVQLLRAEVMGNRRKQSWKEPWGSRHEKPRVLL